MSVTNIQTKIEEIRNQTVQYGNTRAKVADLLTLLNTEKLDRDGVIAVVAEITNLAPEFFEYLQTGNFTVDATGFGLPAELTNTPPNSPTVSIHQAFEAGTYTNWEDATNTPITLTEGDVGLSNVFFFVKNGVVENVQKTPRKAAKYPLAPTDTTPTKAGWYKPTVSGTYANAGGLVAQEGYNTVFYFDGTTWSKVEVVMPQASNEILPHNPAQSYTEGEQFTYRNADGSLGYYSVLEGATLGVGQTPETNPEKVENVGGGSDKDTKKILKHFLENKTFTIQDEVNAVAGTMETWNQQPNGVNSFFTTFIVDNTNKDAEILYIKGKTSYGDSYISARRFDNSYVIISAPKNGIIIDGESTWDLSPYKTIYISLITTSGQFVKTKRSTMNPPVEDAVKKYIDNSVNLLGVFTNGYDLINLPIAKNRGGMKISGAWQSSDYYNYMEIPVVSGYNKLYFKGKGTGYQPELFPAILAIVGTTPTTIKQSSDNEVIEGIFDIPADTKKLYINFGTPIEDADGVPKAVVLIKPSDVKDAVFKYVNKAVGAKPTLTNELLAFPKPKTLIRVDLEGTMPTDKTDARTPTSQVLRMSDEFGKEFLKCNITNKIQGNITAGNTKSNYNIKLLNDAGEKLKVKFGTWFPDSSIHLKGYGQDFSLSRTISGGKLLKQIFDSRPFPKSYIAQFPSNVPSNEPHKNNFLNDANFYIDGFPVEVYHDGVFIGLWIAQQRREPENFHFNDEDENQIFITNENKFEVLQPFNGFYAPHWEVRSPKINGYSAGGAVTNANVLAKLNRFFDWMKGVYNGNINFLATANDYIDIDNWIDVFIHSELIGNADYYSNNLNFGMWADEKVKMFSTDLDLTVGFTGQTTGFFTSFIGFSSLQPQIKARYTELRNKGIIDLNNIFKTYNEIPAIIGSKKMRDNYDYWLPKGGVQQKGKNSIQYIMSWYKDRITWLDSKWLLP